MVCARDRCAREVVVSDSDALLGDAMRAHPEDATIQRSGISCLCLLANVAENLPSMKVREGPPRFFVRANKLLKSTRCCPASEIGWVWEV